MVRSHTSKASRAVKDTPVPPAAKITMKLKTHMVRIRVKPEEHDAWQRRSRELKKTLSAFLRAAAASSAAGIASSSDWRAVLLEARSAMNVALSVRTDEQKNQRILDAVAVINRLLEVAHAGDR
jgi:hypothetical protein